MRKALLIIYGLLLTLQSTAQTKETPSGSDLIGPVTGFGYSRVTNLNGVTLLKPSAYFGVNIIRAIAPHFTFGNSIIISSEGYKVRNEGNEAAVTPVYLRLPFRATYIFGSSRIQPAVFFGPVFGYELSESGYKSTVLNEMFHGMKARQFNNIDFGLNAGLGANIKIADGKYLTLDAGYYQGLLDVINEAASTSNKNQTLTFNVGVLFAVRSKG